MQGPEFYFEDLLEIGRQIQSRKESSVAITKAMLARIGVVDSRLHSFVMLMANDALAQATQADAEIAAGRIRGPLHGVPIAIKDLLHTTNAPTTHGMTIHRNFRADADATCVIRLKEAGAVILGKLQMTEGAFAAHHPDVTAPVNPWGEWVWNGVSSSGSGVSTAAGLCYASIGTDTGGSIRFPSAANGVTGIKPTWGRVSRHGAFALGHSLDHIGPIARSAADAAAVLQAIAGSDVNDPTASQEPVPDYLKLMTRGFSGLTVGVDAGWSDGIIDAPTKAALESVIEVIQKAGGKVRDVVFPDRGQAAQDWGSICAVETAVEHEATFPSRRAEYGSVLAGFIDHGLQVSAMELHKLSMRRAEFRGRVNAMFTDVDLFLAPVTPTAGMSKTFVEECLANPERLNTLVYYTSPFDLSGHPTITLPAGFTPEGAPLAVQFSAAHFAEDLLIRAGWAYQQHTDWHKKHPNV